MPCALAVWSDGGGQGQSKVSLAPAVCISLRFYSPIHPSTYPPTYLPSTHVLLIHPLTTHPSTHLPTPPSIHPPFHPSILLLPSGSNSSPLSSLLICHVPGTTPGPSILAHSLVMETAPPLRLIFSHNSGINLWTDQKKIFQKKSNDSTLLLLP